MSSPHIRSVLDTYAFNNQCVSLSLGDLTNEEAIQRWNGDSGSSISFLVGHMASSRYGLLKRLGSEIENPYADLFGSGASAEDGSTYPTIAELATGWDAVAAQFGEAAGALTEEQILSPAEGFPVPDATLRGALMFLAWHESYHVGQIGILRVRLGKPSIQARLYEAMSKA